MNEETDIRTELDRHKEHRETIWNDLTDKTVYQLSVTSTKYEGTKVLQTSVWTNTVLNYIRQKTGEIEVFEVLEIGTLKWYKENIPRDGNDLTEEGQMPLNDPEL